uniref:Uncharacterized protein n=1 Tax=Lotharella globosa TaxID=91324 RepID=A0A7S3Z368_9EUKA|mmetsp:Transcript_15624/g.31669  ORF Transcript_15624/g.31669 Transcript_15624/m.31669 type:complete len:424 (-) Transcript_15624:193-1464(-)
MMKRGMRGGAKTTPTRHRRKTEESAEALFSQANALYVDENYQQAYELFTQAIQIDSDCAPFYLHRAAAQIQLKNYTQALADAETALKIAPTNTTGRLRKGVALFHLSRFSAAKAAFQDAKRMGHKSVDLWIRKCEAELKGGKASGEVKMTPAPLPSAASNQSTPSVPRTLAAAGSSSSSSKKEAKANATPSPSMSSSAPSAPSSNISKYRMGWYQSARTVSITLYAKGLSNEQVKVVFQPSTVLVQISEQPGRPPWKREFNLAAGIDVGNSKYRLSQFKLEMTLRKATDFDWPELERAVSKPQQQKKHPKTHQPPNHPQPTSSAPNTNPSRKSPYTSGTDWNAVEKKIEDELREEKPEGEAALHALFQKIYANADEATRRAMNKSYQTSNGTVLSTNWGEVAKKDYEKDRQAPAGQEIVDYEY